MQGLMVEYHPDDPFLSKLSKIQAFAMLLYHPIEHYSWVGYAAPGALHQGSVDGAMRITCHLWVVWILVEFVSIRHRWAKLSADEALKEDHKDALRSDMKWRMANMVSDLLLGLHWSCKRGIGLNEPAIAVLGMFGAFVGGYQKWKSMG